MVEEMGVKTNNQRGIFGSFGDDDSLLFFFLILVVLFQCGCISNTDDDSLLFFFLLLVILFGNDFCCWWIKSRIRRDFIFAKLVWHNRAYML